MPGRQRATTGWWLRLQMAPPDGSIKSGNQVKCRALLAHVTAPSSCRVPVSRGTMPAHGQVATAHGAAGVKPGQWMRLGGWLGMEASPMSATWEQCMHQLQSCIKQTAAPSQCKCGPHGVLAPPAALGGQQLTHASQQGPPTALRAVPALPAPSIHLDVAADAVLHAALQRLAGNGTVQCMAQVLPCRQR